MDDLDKKLDEIRKKKKEQMGKVSFERTFENSYFGVEL